MNSVFLKRGDIVSSKEHGVINSSTPGVYMYGPSNTGMSFKKIQTPIDLYCYENADEILEDLDMEKHLEEMTVFNGLNTINKN